MNPPRKLLLYTISTQSAGKTTVLHDAQFRSMAEQRTENGLRVALFTDTISLWRSMTLSPENLSNELHIHEPSENIYKLQCDRPTIYAMQFLMYRASQAAFNAINAFATNDIVLIEFAPRAALLHYAKTLLDLRLITNAQYTLAAASIEQNECTIRAAVPGVQIEFVYLSVPLDMAVQRCMRRARGEDNATLTIFKFHQYHHNLLALVDVLHRAGYIVHTINNEPSLDSGSGAGHLLQMLVNVRSRALFNGRVPTQWNLPHSCD